MGGRLPLPVWGSESPLPPAPPAPPPAPVRGPVPVPTPDPPPPVVASLGTSVTKPLEPGEPPLDLRGIAAGCGGRSNSGVVAAAAAADRAVGGGWAASGVVAGPADRTTIGVCTVTGAARSATTSAGSTCSVMELTSASCVGSVGGATSAGDSDAPLAGAGSWKYMTLAPADPPGAPDGIMSPPVPPPPSSTSPPAKLSVMHQASAPPIATTCNSMLTV